MVAGVTRALSRYVAIIIYHIYVVGGLCYAQIVGLGRGRVPRQPTY